MRLLLDEHVSPRAAAALRDKGHDVVAVSELRQLRGRSDEDVLAYAVQERRAVVTHNFADFLAVTADWARAGREHWGLVLVPINFQRRGVGAYIVACESVLTSNLDADALRGRITWTDGIG